MLLSSEFLRKRLNT